MSKEVKSIALPAKTRAILERALQEQQTMQALLQQQQQRINDLVEAARELLNVPESWRIENTAVGFAPPAEERQEAGEAGASSV